MWNALGKFLFPLLFKLAMWLGAKAFSDGTAQAALENGILSNAWMWRNVYRPRELKALATPGKADDTACYFAKGCLRFDQAEKEQGAKDRETRGNHAGI